MNRVMIAGLLVGAAAATPASANVATIEHATRVDHRSGPVDARYRGDVVVRHRQIGTAAPPGRAATLSCVWAADVTVVREAKTADGVMMTRNYVTKDVAKGQKPGWCNTQRDAIAKEVAARVKDTEVVKQQLAREDVDRLQAEIEHHQGAGRAG